MQTSRQRVIIVDDEKPVRDVIAKCLGSRGYTTAVAAGSDELFNLLQIDRCALVILDVDLADENGLHVLTRVKAAYPALPVIILTGRGYDEPLLQQARECGADGYLSKALPITELMLSIKRVLRETSQLAADADAA